MSELSFLIELLLNHKLTKTTKDLIQARIKEIELIQTRPPTPIQARQPVATPAPVINVAQPEMVSFTNPDGSTSQIDLSKQSASMRAKIMAQVDPNYVAPVQEAAPAPVPVKNVAQSPTAIAALASRQQALAASFSAIPEKGLKQPRKF